MTKIEYFSDLYNALHGLPEQDIEEQLHFFSEMVDDRIEEGLSEEEAISQLGSVDKLTEQILAQYPITKIIKAKKKRNFSTGEIVLLALGAPLWFPLLVAAIVVVISLYAAWWSVVISLWAVFAAFIGSSIGGIVGGAIIAFTGHALSGLALIGAGLVCIGLSVFAFYGCKAATKGTVVLTKEMWLRFKKRILA